MADNFEDDQVVDELYSASKARYKEYDAQVKCFCNNGVPINGQPEPVDGIIYRFIEGFLDGGELPAIEMPGHLEFWEKGRIKKIVTDNFDTIEYWENGKVLSIETNIAERRKNGEEFK